MILSGIALTTFVLSKKNKKVVGVFILSLFLLQPLSVQSTEVSSIQIYLTAEILKDNCFKFQPDYPVFNDHASDAKYYDYSEGMTWGEFLESNYNR